MVYFFLSKTKSCQKKGCLRVPLIALWIIGVVLCFFSVRLRRLIPCVTGIIIGLLIGFVLKAGTDIRELMLGWQSTFVQYERIDILRALTEFYKSMENLFSPYLTDTEGLGNLFGVISEQITTIRDFKSVFDFLSACLNEIDFGYLVLPLICAGVLGFLSAAFYRLFFAIEFGMISYLFWRFVLFVFWGSETLLIALALAAVSAVLFYLLFHIMFILSTAAYGGSILMTALERSGIVTNSSKKDFIFLVIIIFGAFAQAIQLNYQRHVHKG